MARSSRRGVALILALVILATAAATVASLAVSISSQRLHALFADRQRALGELMQDAERAGGQWLTQCAPGIVLPPAGGGVAILDARWVDQHGHRWACQVSAFDVHAALPHALLEAGHALHQALPEGLRNRQLSASQVTAPIPGAWLLDQPIPSGWTRFPVPAASHPVMWSDGGRDSEGTDDPVPTYAPALAQQISPWNANTLNIATAPEDLLRSTLELLGQRDNEAILDARRLGKTPPLPGTLPANAAIQLSTSSDRWALLVSASCDGQRRAWWTVMLGSPQGAVILQRLACDTPRETLPLP